MELLGGRTSDSDRGCGNNYFCIVFKAGFPSFDSDKVNYKMSQIDWKLLLSSWVISYLCELLI